MAKQNRIYLTVDEATKKYLEQWAEQEGRSVTNLSSWIVKREVDKAIERGQVKPKS